MPPLLYLVVGFSAGWYMGRRHGILAAMRREASSVIDSIGRMNNLHSLEGLHLKHGDDKTGVKVLLKTRAPDPIDYSMMFDDDLSQSVADELR
jgi:hypothetical protein